MTDHYTPIHNEVLEALCKINLSPYEIRVLFAIWRKTYGFVDRKTGLRKKYDYIAVSQFVDLTGLDRRHISRALKGLKTKNVISRDDKKTGLSKEFMRLMSSVEMTDGESAVPVEMTGIPSRDDKGVPLLADTKERKETYTKETDTFLIKFNTLFGSAYRTNKDRREKLHLRLKKFSLDEILTALENLSNSEFHKGENERGWVADPDFLIRSDSQIDKWLNHKPKNKEPFANYKLIPRNESN